MDASIMSCSYLVDDSGDGSCNNENDKIGPSTSAAGESITIKEPHQIIQRRKYPASPQPTCGAVAGVEQVKNPVSLARAVMDRTPHVMLIGKGAEEFSRSLPQDVVQTRPDEYFLTERRWNQLVKVRELEAEQIQQKEAEVGGKTNLVWKHMMKVQLDHAGDADANQDTLDQERKFGTVGAVALYCPCEKNSQSTNCRAQLASATSTGGLTNARFHRVGDSPIIGAGTYANHLCAISCTGHGEHFLRCVAAHDIAKRLEYKHGYGNDRNEKRDKADALQRSVEEVIFGTLMGDGKDDEGGDGGVIALDGYGNFVAEFNCPGMYHGWVYEDGTMETRIFWDE
mmetsp:Transcript_33299/g.69993  ORF Transcript_33299/g.69993 Transcript_33299/m.69993 type:complete len:341 (+) Transcript_33299:281-1303(+)